MIFTHCGKLGDFFHTLPIANWYWKTTGEKIHYVLSDRFPAFTHIVPTFYQFLPYVSCISLVPHVIENYSCGGQPYRFNPSDYGIEGKYFNMGFRHFPDKFTTLFVAEEHGFGIDYTDVINIQPNEKSKDIKLFTNEFDKIAPRINTLDYKELLFSDPLPYNISKMLKASEIRTFMSGFSTLCDMLNPVATYIYHANEQIDHYGPIFYKHHDFYKKFNRYVSVL